MSRSKTSNLCCKTFLVRSAFDVLESIITKWAFIRKNYEEENDAFHPQEDKCFSDCSETLADAETVVSEGVDTAGHMVQLVCLRSDVEPLRPSDLRDGLTILPVSTATASNQQPRTILRSVLQ